MHHHSTFNVFYNSLKSDSKRQVSTLGGNRKTSPNAMKLNKITPNFYELNIKIIKSINKIPFIHKTSVFYLSIQIHQHYIGSQQGSGEMAPFLHCLTFLHEIFQYFDLRVFQNLKYRAVKS